MASYHPGRAPTVIDEALRPVLEPLESRTLLSASIDNGILNIIGTDARDEINIKPSRSGDSLKVLFDNQWNFFKMSDVQGINIDTGDGNDSITIAEVRHRIEMPATINGGAGDDFIQGGGGNDLILGGDGNDSILGGRGNDNVDGGAGNDTLPASTGVDSLNGGDGDDLIIRNGDDDSVIASGGSDNVAQGAATNFPIQTFTGVPSGYTVRQMRAAYGFGDLEDPSYTNRGKGQTIVIIIAFHAPRARKDLIEFARTEHTLPGVKNLKKYFDTHFHQVWMGPNSDKPSAEDWNGEAMLDIQWAHAIAPEAKIVLVEAENNFAGNLEASIQEGVRILQKTRSHGGVISMSWGFLTTAADQIAFETVFEDDRNKNISFVVSAGDIGGLTSGTPVGPPSVTVVGGTKLFLDPFGNRVTGINNDAPIPQVNGGLTPPPPVIDNWNTDTDCADAILDDTGVPSQTGISGGEGAWWEGGGGPTPTFAAPFWQQNRIGNLLVDTDGDGVLDRATPDVAYNADPATGVPVFNSFGSGGQSGWQQVGGTSAGAPQFAALVTLANQLRAAHHKHPIGRTLNERIYRLGGRGPDQYFNDIDVHGSGLVSLAIACSDSGHAGGFVFDATPGWDYATGWGSPNARSLIPALADEKLKFLRRNMRFRGRITQRIPNPATGQTPLEISNFVGNTSIIGYHTLTMSSFRMVHVSTNIGSGGTGNTTITTAIDIFGMDEQDGQPNVPAYSGTLTNPVNGLGLLLAPGSPVHFSRNGNNITGRAFYLVTVNVTTAPGGGGGGGTTTTNFRYFPLQFRGKINKNKITGEFFTVDINGQRVKGSFNTADDPVVSGSFESVS